MEGRKNTSGCLVPVLLMILILLVSWQSIVLQREQRQSQEQIRTQLLDKIYSEAHFRVRQEAARAFIEIEGERGVAPNLSGADLSGMKLIMVNLSGADLSGTNLRGTNLSASNLSGADLNGADLSLANLLLADLSAADLSGADLNSLDRADLPDLAKLVDLSDLSDATLENLNDAALGELFVTARLRMVSQEQIDSAQGDENTRLHESLNRPEHWLEFDRELNRSEHWPEFDRESNRPK